MSGLRWLSVLLLALALAAGAAWWLQRQSAAQLRDEIGLLRGENRELARLRAENARLSAALPPAAQLEAMRADHAAVLRLRGEIEKLKAETDRQAQAVARKALLPSISASECKNVGRATPAATVQTLLWAASHRDVDALASMLTFDAQLRPAVDRFFAIIPEELRNQYGTVERLVADSMSKNLSLAGMSIAEENQTDADHAALVVRQKNADGITKELPISLQRGNDGWALAVPARAVQEIANEIGMQSAGARKSG